MCGIGAAPHICVPLSHTNVRVVSAVRRMLKAGHLPMKLRIAGRHDSLLLAGFAFALLVIFQGSLRYLFAVANDIERTYGVALVPALLILSIMFVFHLHSNRRE